MIKVLEDYIHLIELDINNKFINNSSMQLYDFILNNFAESSDNHYDDQATMTTKLFTEYNVLMYPFSEFHKLYEEIRKCFRFIANPTEPHYIQCWLNVYRQNNFIDWHSHWEPQHKTYHGYFCVEGTNTITSYRLPNGKEVDILNKNNQLVLSPSDGDQHRTHPYEGADSNPRITIAFDIVPARFIDTGINHWLPI